MICINVYSENCILNTRYDVIFSDYINSHLNTQLKLPKSFLALYIFIPFECIFFLSDPVQTLYSQQKSTPSGVLICPHSYKE